jgi:hypothetical protein
MNKKLLDYDEADEILKPYYDSIVASIYKGYNDFKLMQSIMSDSGNLADFEIRTRASFIHDQIRKHLTQCFENNSNVSVGQFNKLFGIVIEKKMFIRFKKINSNYSTSNINTIQTRNFSMQTGIEGIPEQVTHLSAGYTPNRFWTDIQDIQIMCKIGEQLRWSKNLNSHIEQLEFKFETKNTTEEIIIPKIKLKSSIDKSKLG